jgi:hypothetical protein
MAKQTETNDVREIPPDYVPLASYEPHGHGKKGGQWYQRLYKAWAAKQLGGMRVILGGKRAQIFVNPLEVQGLIEQWTHEDHHSAAATNCQTRLIGDRQAESVCESLADIASGLGHVVTLLDRIAAAAESIATQPKTPQQELLHLMNGNGFHS